MAVTTRFNRSLYVTLGLACACLGYAELVFLPEMSVYTAIVGLLLAVAYAMEGRWALNIRAANILGGVIAVGAVGWIASQFFRPWGRTLLDELPWPSSLLPYLGPLLMILIPAKLFRPKHHGDYWSLQGIGLMAVALGSAMAGDLIFGALMLAYVAGVVWSLTLFFYYRQYDPAAGGAAARRPAVPPYALLQSGYWTVSVVGLGLVLFLITPRALEARWQLSLKSKRMQTGYDERPSIDLNNSGSLKVNRDLAFEVRAFQADGQTPKTDLDTDQRWRGTVFNYYEGGRWEYRPQAWESRTLIPAGPAQGLRRPDEPPRRGGDAPPPPPLGRGGPRRPDEPPREGGKGGPAPDPRPDRPAADPFERAVQRAGAVTLEPYPTNYELPNLGPNQVILEYHPHTRGTRTVVLAEPVWPAGLRPGSRRVPVGTALNPPAPGARPRLVPWVSSIDHELSPQPFSVVDGRHVYRQVLLPPAEPGVGPPVPVDEFYREHLRQHQAVPRLRDWTRDLLHRLAAEQKLPEAALPRPEAGSGALRVPEEYYEAVARAVESHLSSSGEFRYSLDLERHDRKIDPVEDFVLNTRLGHCNRFATALALMLRTQGIPTRIVLGFRGSETEGDGVYDIRQSNAHSWVEALVRRGAGGQTTWHWLTLDATPVTEEVATVAGGFVNWWYVIRDGFTGFYKNFIVEYDADQQDRARSSLLGSINWSAVGRPLLGPGGDDWGRGAALLLGGVGAVVGGRYLLRRRRGRRVAPPDPATAFYRRLLDVVARHLGLQPRDGQTPGEFAADAVRRLLALGAAPELAGVPGETAVLYYRVRYGARPLDAAERQALDARLDRLEAALAARPGPVELAAGGG